MKTILLVGIGSFIGGALRHGISTLLNKYASTGFPVGTLAVNLLGCLLIGMIFALFSKYSSVSSQWCIFMTTGICGGFTTFSAFSNEGVKMLYAGQYAMFFCYVGVSVLVGILLTAFGYWLVK